MYSLESIRKTAQRLYGVKLRKLEPVVQTMHRELNHSQPITEEVFNEFIAKEEHVGSNLLIAAAIKNLNRTPSDWSLIPKLDMALALSLPPPDGPTFYHTLINTISEPSHTDPAMRLMLMLQCINRPAFNRNDLDADKVDAIHALIESFWPTLDTSPDRIANKARSELHNALLNTRIPIASSTPLIQSIIREGKLFFTTQVTKLFDLVHRHPELKSSAAESLIKSNTRLYPQDRLTPGNARLEKLRDWCVSANASSLEWTRCAAALILTTNTHSELLTTIVVDTVRELDPQRWDDLQVQCNIYLELYGAPSTDEVSHAIDYIVKDLSTPEAPYSLPVLELR